MGVAPTCTTSNGRKQKNKKKKKIEAVNTAIEEDVLGGTFGNDSCRAKMRKDKGFFFVFFFFFFDCFPTKSILKEEEERRSLDYHLSNQKTKVFTLTFTHSRKQRKNQNSHHKQRSTTTKHRLGTSLLSVTRRFPYFFIVLESMKES